MVRKEVHRRGGRSCRAIAAYERGEFVWFAFTASKIYGEAFFGERALRQMISEEGLPLTIVDFDASSLSQDVFLLRRASN